MRCELAAGLIDLLSMMERGRVALLLFCFYYNAAGGLPGRAGFGGSPVFKYLLGFFADDWMGWLLLSADSLEALLKLRIGAL